MNGQMQDPDLPVLPARPRNVRAALMAFYTAVWLGAGFVFSLRTGVYDLSRVRLGGYPTAAAQEAAFRDAWAQVDQPALVAAFVLTLLVWGLLAGRAGYRGSRFLQLLVPFWNWGVMVRILWRWTDIKGWEIAAETADEASAAALEPVPYYLTSDSPLVDVTAR